MDALSRLLRAPMRVPALARRRSPLAGSRWPRASIMLAALLSLVGCASAPSRQTLVIPSEGELVSVLDRADARIQRYVDPKALESIERIRLPSVELLPEAAGPGITPEQADLVANHGARVLCNRLAPYFEIVDEREPAADAAELRVVITAIAPTNAAVAGVSSLIDVVVPGPARLPAGLGGLAAEAELRSAGGEQVLVKAWARGANAVTKSAQVSPIGDAWQLAGDFGAELARALIRSDANGQARPRLDEPLREAGRDKCRLAFGTVNLGARGVSRLVPLPPESFDAGRPKPPSAAALHEAEAEDPVDEDTGRS